MNTMTFPEVVGKLMEAGFESYAVDNRLRQPSYYHARRRQRQLRHIK